MAGCTRAVSYSKKTLFYKVAVYLNKFKKKQQQHFDHTVAFYYFKNANES